MARSERGAIPDDLLYTEDHEWVREADEFVRIGITDFAQDALGDVVFVTTPDVGASVVAGEPMGELESTKSVADWSRRYRASSRRSTSGSTASPSS